MTRKPKIDIRAESHGSVALLRPLTHAGREWLIDNVAAEPWQWLGGALAAEPRMVQDVIDGAQDAGLTVEAGR